GCGVAIQSSAGDACRSAGSEAEDGAAGGSACGNAGACEGVFPPGPGEDEASGAGCGVRPSGPDCGVAGEPEPTASGSCSAPRSCPRIGRSVARDGDRQARI